jgi:hypothetical protein
MTKNTASGRKRSVLTKRTSLFIVTAVKDLCHRFVKVKERLSNRIVVSTWLATLSVIMVSVLWSTDIWPTDIWSTDI